MADVRDDTAEPGSKAPAHWPKGVSPLTFGAIEMMGFKEDTNELYWDGRPVEVRRRLDLTRGERGFAVIVGLFTILGSIGAVAQGWAAAHQWGCQTAIVERWCPPPTGR